MDFITARRASRLRVLISNLAEGERESEELGRLEAQIRTDYHGRFLIELVQNGVDPALAAGLTASHLLIVRTPELLAVLNQGTPFDEAGLTSIMSLALSPKRPDEAIGNKGVGFKSVFEVATSAEIYSVGSATENLKGAPALGLHLSLAPASEQQALVEEGLRLLDADPASAAVIAGRHGSVEGALRAALSNTPGWRYPEPLGPDAWARRAKDLGLRATDRARFQTAVVLRLSAPAVDKVSRALDGLIADGHETHLFLPGVRRIEVREEAGTTTLEREDTWTDPSQGFAVRRLRTSVRGGAPVERRFWVATATLNSPEVAVAARTLPGAGWSEVKTAVVQVALPMPEPDQALPVDGRYFVGLPTRDATGSPFRVDARFHATLSRTALDRRDNLYNAMLDRGAAELAARLLRRLRDARPKDRLLVDPELGRRAVTLGLAGGGVGGFGQAVRRHLADEPTILLLDGERYGAPAACRLVEEDEAGLIDLIDPTLGQDVWSTYRLQLIETPLEHTASGLLRDLGVPALKPAELVQRVEGASVMERLAAKLPRDELEGWETLLLWLASRLPEGAEDQRVLPLAGDRLAAPATRPFVPLLEMPAPGELRADEVPAHLLAGLDFLNARLISNPDLRRILVEGARPLARRPAPTEILSGAVLPALEAAAQGGQDEDARGLLQLGLKLLGHVGQDDEVQQLPWWVPCVSGWRPAEDAYLGDAWDPGRNGREDEEGDEPRKPGVVERVYGPEGRCLVPWWGTARDVAATRAALIRIGVAAEPRLLAFPRIEKVIWGDQRQGTWHTYQPPAVIPRDLWQDWIREVLVASVGSVDWGPRTWWHLDDVEWIDGLERPDARSSLAAWALGMSSVDHALLVPQRERPNRWESSVQLTQPWMFVLRSLSEPFVPTHPKCALAGAVALPSDLCQTPAALKVDWLPRPADGLSKTMLDQIGVRPLAEMPTAWLLDQLSRFCRGAIDLGRRGVIARHLWDLLSKRAAKESFPSLSGYALPLWCDGEVIAVEADQVAELVLIDDAYAAEVLGDKLDGALVLEPEGEDWRLLLLRLQERLPDARLRRVSEIPFPYAESPAATLPLLVELARRAGLLAVQVLCALVRVPRQGVQDKEKERAWTALRGASVQFGVLPESALSAVWLRGPGVLLCKDLDAPGLIAALWPVLGPAWRDDLLALGDALRRGERGVRDLMRHKRLKEEAIHEAAARCHLDVVLGTVALIAPNPPKDRAPSQVITPTRATEADPSEADDEAEADLGRVLQAVLHAKPSPLPVPSVGPQRSAVQGSPGRARRGARRGSEDYVREIGHLGEVFAFRALAAQLPGFNEDCWVSSSRAWMDLPGGDDALGYDFRYVDTTGALSGRPGVVCYIDVKANGGALKDRFAISSNEWRLAERCSGSEAEVFILLRVWGIASEPRLGPVHVDPVALTRTGLLTLSPKDGWWATGGEIESAEGEE